MTVFLLWSLWDALNSPPSTLVDEAPESMDALANVSKQFFEYMLRTNVPCAFHSRRGPRFVDCRGGPSRTFL